MRDSILLRGPIVAIAAIIQCTCHNMVSQVVTVISPDQEICMEDHPLQMPTGVADILRSLMADRVSSNILVCTQILCLTREKDRRTIRAGIARPMDLDLVTRA